MNPPFGHPNPAMTAEYAYCGGLVDGEGYVGIAKRIPTSKNHSTTARYTPRISISMCSNVPIKFFLKTFSIPDTKVSYRSKRNTNWRGCYHLDLECSTAITVARILVDFCILKREQLLLLLRLSDSTPKTRFERTERFRFSKFVAGNAKGHRLALRQRSGEYLQSCESIYRACKVLNRRGT